LERHLDSSGVLLWPGAPVLIGREEISRFSRTLSARDSLRLTWQPLGLFLDRDSLTGVTWGVAVTTGASAVSFPTIGRYISAWRRETDRWKLTALVVTGAPASDLSQVPPNIPLTRRAASQSPGTEVYVEADLAFARLAAKRGAGAAFRTWAAPDAVIFGGSGVLIRGPDAIGQAVSGPEHWQWHPVAAGGVRGGDLGWTAGEAEIRGGDGTTYSKYLTIWRRTREGAVRFVIDGGNQRPADRQ
jgi:hypothetical protein